jgi:hypothetical protein
MSSTVDAPSEPSATATPGRGRLDLSRGVPVCPFLRSRDAAWSSAAPSRDLRCWAVQPAAQLAAGKQRQLCATADHHACATYAVAMAPDTAGSADVDGVDLWPSASSVPVALESVRTRPGVSVTSPPSGSQALLVGLMVVAFVVLVVARTSVPFGGGAAASPSPAASALVAASTSPLASDAVASPVESAAPSPVPSAPTATPSAAASPAASAAPSAAARTYRVKSGDTLSSIAGKFNTTVKAIVAANAIADPKTIRTGQVLVIP